LNDPSGVRISDKFSLLTAKITFASMRNLARLFLGLNKRDELFRKHSFTFISILKRITKSPIMVKNLDGIFFCRSSEIDVVIIADEHENFLKEKYKPENGQIVIDLGAHVGKYAIRSGKIVGSKGMVIAVEAEPESYEIMCKNIELNNLQSIVTPLNIAISNKNGKIPFFVSEGQSNVSSMYTKWSKQIEVDAITIDELIKRYKLEKVEWLQMDMEGAEYDAILGATDSIKNGIVENFIIETHTSQNFNLIPPLMNQYYDIEIFARSGPDFGYLICKRKSN
jgi:FkbM family methyltransferase